MAKSLPSSGDHRVRQAKRRLVLDIFLRRGEVWERVREVREHWGIEAQKCMPPPYRGDIYIPEWFGPPPDEEFGERAEQWYATVDEWRSDLTTLYRTIVPEEAHDSGYLSSGWGVFLSMCVLYDPPETRLLDFADTFRWEYSNVHSSNGFFMNAPPIVWRCDSNELELTWMEFYEGLIGALLSKYVHPQGVTTEEAMRSIREENSELYERRRQRLRKNESRPFIDVQADHTTAEDIESAAKVLRAWYKTRSSAGRKKRDELTAVQCAILHDRYNLPDHEDGRRRPWAYERLAEKFAMESARAAKAHVELGRELLDQYRVQ
jgi:hypothetical protein